MNAIQVQPIEISQQPGMLEYQEPVNQYEMARGQIQDVALDQVRLIDQNGMYVGTDNDFTKDTADAICTNWNSLTKKERQALLAHRKDITSILSGEDPRILFNTGPCSIEDPQAAMELIDYYASLQQESDVRANVKIVLRLYFEKPRTQAFDTQGNPTWWGYTANPFRDPEKTKIIDAEAVRQAVELINYAHTKGLAVSTEFLNVELMQYIAHLIDMVAVGARTVNHPKYLKMAGALSAYGTAIGFKNDLQGDESGAIQAMNSVADANPNTTLILRGGEGDVVNWDRLSYSVNGRRVMVDVCHGNSNKDLAESERILGLLLAKLKSTQDFPQAIMLESHLDATRSKTDPCVSKETTKKWIKAYADANKARRQLVA